jgi:hypothetical protein
MQVKPQALLTCGRVATVNRRPTLTPGCLRPRYSYKKTIPVVTGVKIARRIRHAIVFLSPYALRVYARNEVGVTFDAASH